MEMSVSAMDQMRRAHVHCSELSTPIGDLVIAATDKGLCAIEFGRYGEVESRLKKWSMRWHNTDDLVLVLPSDAERFTKAEKILAAAAVQLRQYFARERNEFALELDMYGTDFQQRVWRALQRIPYGQTRSYKEVGFDIGAQRAVRAIGGANNRNPLAIVIPCHRVIGADGSLVGYGGGVHIKQFLLELEKGN
jgi:O-6-methylguanine DNA methyltransferase